MEWQPEIGNPKVWLTDGPTNQLTGVGSRDTCVSNNDLLLFCWIRKKFHILEHNICNLVHNICNLAHNIRNLAHNMRNPKVWLTYLQTDQLTGLGSRDTCVSKNCVPPKEIVKFKPRLLKLAQISAWVTRFSWPSVQTLSPFVFILCKINLVLEYLSITRQLWEMKPQEWIFSLFTPISVFANPLLMPFVLCASASFLHKMLQILHLIDFYISLLNFSFIFKATIYFSQYIYLCETKTPTQPKLSER